MNDSLQQTSPIYTWNGIVAEDKLPQSISIKVFIPELTPTATGSLSPVTANQSVSLKDINGNLVNSSVTTGNTITAYYLSNTSNRRYPPDVVKGEQVRITKLGNSDKYYWECIGRDDALRQTETHRIDVANRKPPDSNSNEPDTTGTPLDDTNTYSVEVDTKKNQHIRLQTSKGNGEKFSYVMKLDAKNGLVELSDDVGNSFTIDSNATKVMLRNAKKSFVLLNGEDIVVGAPRDITLKADRQILINSPLITISAQGGSGVLSVIATVISQSASSAITTTSPSIGLTGAVQIPQTLTAGLIKAGSYTNGSPSGTYPPASIDLGSGSASTPSVSPDTAPATAQRHSAAYEDVNDAMTTIVTCFNQIQSHIGVPTSHPQITPQSNNSKMTNLMGS